MKQQSISKLSLDQLFAHAAASEANLTDDNFTKIVLNSLPTKVRRTDYRRYFADFVGLTIGLIVAVLVVEPVQLVNEILALIPQSIVISPLNVLTLTAGLSATAVAAWWSVEKNG